MLKELTFLPGDVRAMEAVGTVTADDYEQVFAPIVRQARRSGRRLRLLYQFGPDFNRLTPGALWADTRLGAGYLRLLDGCAVVTDLDWIREPTRGIGAWLPCPLRVFDNDARDDAIAWLNSLPEGPAVSARDMAKAYLGGSVGALGRLAALAISKGIKARDGSR
ncbi:STAS/SEC14 domain-containing protein [Mycobacterium arosiense]|uniref:STAS/SEC14 domain-containing protein n=1 Tax=Mycobacterium arosiense ATCC BAA-1401 = DSM 45069 TaxID=1265311 RepID=A0A1W9ZDB6_MYCAI|nr:STAS/SEC14 domain-containing protein [Mycobacterium arosiense]ORA12138.1 STAS/SEC14 domain-containing protein [Mycobacterium arosiense ATCC BAA-1401 = DSM 45069]